MSKRPSAIRPAYNLSAASKAPPTGAVRDVVTLLMKRRAAMLQSWRLPRTSNHQKRRKRMRVKR